MKKIFIYFLIIYLTFSCKKEQVESNAPFIGYWVIEELDSIKYVNPPGEFRFKEKLESSGTIVFNSDNRGIVNCDRAGLTDFQSDFIWDYDSINKIIDFSFKNGTTIGIITQLSDSMMTMYYRYYLGFPDWYAKCYYKITLKK
jgi:hypothetical protein